MSAYTSSGAFNKTSASILATEHAANKTYIHDLYTGYEQYSPLSLYNGEVPSMAFNITAMAFFGVCTL